MEKLTFNIFEKEIKTNTRNILKNKQLSERSLTYIENYMIEIEKFNLLPPEKNYLDLLADLNEKITQIVFFDEKHPINKEHGYKFKGFTSKKEEDSGTLYIRESLGDYAEVVFYHELTHLLQQHEFGLTGLEYLDEQNLQRGSLGNEVQTQYIADLIYNDIHQNPTVSNTFDSGDLRMLEGVSITSSLTNYQPFDYLFQKYLSAKNLDIKTAIQTAFQSSEKVINFWKRPLPFRTEKQHTSILYAMQRVYITDKFIYTYIDKEKNISGKNILEKIHKDNPKLYFKVNLNTETFLISMQNELILYQAMIQEFNKIITQNNMLNQPTDNDTLKDVETHSHKR